MRLTKATKKVAPLTSLYLDSSNAVLIGGVDQNILPKYSRDNFNTIVFSRAPTKTGVSKQRIPVGYCGLILLLMRLSHCVQG